MEQKGYTFPQNGAKRLHTPKEKDTFSGKWWQKSKILNNFEQENWSPSQDSRHRFACIYLP